MQPQYVESCPSLGRRWSSAVKECHSLIDFLRQPGEDFTGISRFISKRHIVLSRCIELHQWFVDLNHPQSLLLARFGYFRDDVRELSDRVHHGLQLLPRAALQCRAVFHSVHVVSYQFFYFLSCFSAATIELTDFSRNHSEALPCSPARAGLIAALSAKRFVWNAIIIDDTDILTNLLTRTGNTFHGGHCSAGGFPALCSTVAGVFGQFTSALRVR